VIPRVLGTTPATVQLLQKQGPGECSYPALAGSFALLGRDVDTLRGTAQARPVVDAYTAVVHNILWSTASR
jgi:hypothetical protein